MPLAYLHGCHPGQLDPVALHSRDTYLRTYVRVWSSAFGSLDRRERRRVEGEGVKTDSRPTRKILETARQDGRPTKSEERGHATAA